MGATVGEPAEVDGDPRARVRRQLRQRLEDLAPTYNWQSITQQVGMFWFSGLSRSQGMALADHHVYVMPSNGRMNLCGVNSSNVEHLAKAVAAVVTNLK